VKTVKLSNLPDNADTIIIGQKYSQILDNPLKLLGISPLFVPSNPYVDSRLSGHADLSVLHVGENELCLAPYLKASEFSCQLKSMGFDLHYPEIKQAKDYPRDAQLNVCLVGNKAICNPDVCYYSIANLFTNVIPVQQGYSKCSVCVVDEHSTITSDRGIYHSAKASGLDVLLINPGYIRLDGFSYGFIGGSTFKISKQKIAFTGTLDSHPDKAKILNFLHDRQIEPVYLTNQPIFDIGSAIPITEKP
jgi:hypothetical protein